MADTPALPTFLWLLFQGLRRRGFAMGPAEYEALRDSLRAGFGWKSRQDLRDLCSSLWAKSRQEQETLNALFEQLAPEPEEWEYSFDLGEEYISEEIGASEKLPVSSEGKKVQKIISKTDSLGALPPISLADVEVSERHFIFTPQFPLAYREVAQTWRRLRRPIRSGAPRELDLEGTIMRRSRLGIATPIVLQPRRRNRARLLLLVDRQGSMDPFHQFCDEVCTAIRQAGRLDETQVYYFHNIPAEGADEHVLKPLSGQLFPSLDPILTQIQPLMDGFLYADSDMLSPEPLVDILKSCSVDTFIVFISDAGAARNRYRVPRLLDTVASLKAFRSYTTHYVWLNPLPRIYWSDTTAGQIARYVPMFPLDSEGIQRAVNVLRGQQYMVDRTL